MHFNIYYICIIIDFAFVFAKKQIDNAVLNDRII